MLLLEPPANKPEGHELKLDCDSSQHFKQCFLSPSFVCLYLKAFKEVGFVSSLYSNSRLRNQTYHIGGCPLGPDIMLSSPFMLLSPRSGSDARMVGPGQEQSWPPNNVGN